MSRGAEGDVGGAYRPLGQKASWPVTIADLDALTETEQDGGRFLLCPAPKPATSLALRTAGVAPPPTVRAISAD